jgi:hypothetical protein
MRRNAYTAYYFMLCKHYGAMKLQEDYFGLLTAARSALKFSTLFAQWIKSEHY